jgi:hypothetical protein
MELNKPIELLHMNSVLMGEDDKGTTTFILLLDDRNGVRHGTTLICRSIYAAGIKKSWGRLQGVPLPVEEAPSVPAEVGDDGTVYGHYEEAKVEIEPT